MTKFSISDCGCTDYSQLTANTGLAKVSVANPYLDGTGTTVTVLTAAANGTILKSIVIKAIQSTTEGMVRLFIKDSADICLIREIPISIYPSLNSTPTPAPLLPMLEIDLVEPIILKSGQQLLASSQTNQSINIIAEGLNWAYPAIEPLPGCCDFLQKTSNTSIKTISTANTNLNGTGTITRISTAALNGTRIKLITIVALSSTKEDIVRFFLNDGTTSFLWIEVVIPPSTQASYIPSLKIQLDEDFYLKGNYSIYASTNNGQQYAITIEGDSWSYPI